MEREKITEALTSAINHLENSMRALVKNDGNEVMSPVWRAAANLEYALFLFFILQGESESSSWKRDSRLKQVESGPILVAAQDLLKEAKSKIDAGELHETRMKTWIARDYLLKVQEIFEKGRRSRGKSTLPPP